MRTSPWLYISKKNPAARLRLICFPYAGASAFCFRTWAGQLPADVELAAVQLPGRENRFGEPLLTDAAVAAQAIAAALHGLEDHRPCVFFGHSLGASLAYEVAQLLYQARRRCAPHHLIVSGRRAPMVARRERLLHLLPDSELKLELRDMNCTPPAVLEHDELMDLLMPRLRADFEMAETCVHQHSLPLPCPLSAWGGNADEDVSAADLAAWEPLTASAFTQQEFDGDHFFIHGVEQQVLQSVSAVLASVINHASLNVA